MTSFHTTIDIQAPPERVWTILRDIEHWPEWTPTVSRIRLLDPSPLAVGARALVHQPSLFPARWQITELEEGRGFTWITRSLGVIVSGRHFVEGAANGSRVTLSLDFSGPFGSLVARLTRGLDKRYLALEAEGLKKHAEVYALTRASDG